MKAFDQCFAVVLFISLDLFGSSLLSRHPENVSIQSNWAILLCSSVYFTVQLQDGFNLLTSEFMDEISNVALQMKVTKQSISKCGAEQVGSLHLLFHLKYYIFT